MPQIPYVDKKFNARSMQMIYAASQILEEYVADGWNLSLRQLYYVFVSRDMIENTERSYKNLGVLINNARMAGYIDWDHIEDRTRGRKSNEFWDSPKHAIEDAVKYYHNDLWADQPKRVEVWVEKDALIEVVASACQPLDVPYLSCRGYMSQSEMWQAARRFQASEMDNAQETVIIHLGDHDPSGIDMTRDIRDRIDLFNDYEMCEGFTMNRIALTMDQIDEYDPPPNPAKVTDSRAADYIRRYGRSSWELDALPPKVLKDLILKNIVQYMDYDLFTAAKAKVEVGRKQLKSIAGKLD